MMADFYKNPETSDLSEMTSFERAFGYKINSEIRSLIVEWPRVDDVLPHLLGDSIPESMYNTDVNHIIRYLYSRLFIDICTCRNFYSKIRS